MIYNLKRDKLSLRKNQDKYEEQENINEESSENKINFKDYDNMLSPYNSSEYLIEFKSSPFFEDDDFGVNESILYSSSQLEELSNSDTKIMSVNDRLERNTKIESIFPFN